MKQILKFVKPFYSFLNESSSDWRELNSWKILQKIGFKEIEEKKNGTIIIGGRDGRSFAITTSGYIRDPSRYGTSNSIVQILPDSEDFPDYAFKYFVSKHLKEIKKLDDPSIKSSLLQIEGDFDGELKKLIKDPLLTPDQNYFLAAYVKGSWSYDASTERVTINGILSGERNKFLPRLLRGKRFNTKKLEELKFDTITNCDFSWNFGVDEDGIYGDILKVTNDFNVNLFENTLQQDRIVKSLKGAPKEVGNFYFYGGLVSLEGFPITKNFTVSYGILTSLKGAPQKVGGNFNCSRNQLTSLAEAPQKVGGSFYCGRNKLTSLVGAPQDVVDYFDCSYNELNTLEGAPEKVEGDFNCSNNQLTSLVGSPQEVGGDFDCSSNKLTSLEGAPQIIEGIFISEFFNIPKGKWGFEGWMDVFKNGDEKAKFLISTILSSSHVNSEIQKNPEEMLMKLKGVWNSPDFANIKKGIKIPEKYRVEMGTLADLNDLGF